MKEQRIRWRRSEYARRRAAGVCSSCDRTTAINPRTGKPLSRCQRHSQQAAAACRRYVTAMRQRWLSRGCCCECGAPCGLNRQNGKPYRRCLTHRLAGAVHTRDYAYRLRFSKAQTQESADDARVFAVIGFTGATQTAIRGIAKMDTGRCFSALQRLTANGAVLRDAAKSGGRGRPSWLYRRVQATQEAA